MKTNILKIAGRTLQSLAVLAMALGITGCSSVGFKTGDKTSASLQRASRSVETETQALDATIGSLAMLVNSPEMDLKPQFKQFSASLDRLVNSVDKADRSIARLRSNGAEYLAAWDAELAAMNYEVIRESSEARRNSVSNQLALVCQRYDEAQEVVRPFISYFSDLQRSLGTDLTAEGIASAREVVRKAEENTRKVQNALEQLRAELSVSSGRLSSVLANEPLAATGSAGPASGTQREAVLH
jgi:hypothetical protein